MSDNEEEYDVGVNFVGLQKTVAELTKKLKVVFFFLFSFFFLFFFMKGGEKITVVVNGGGKHNTPEEEEKNTTNKYQFRVVQLHLWLSPSLSKRGINGPERSLKKLLLVVLFFCFFFVVVVSFSFTERGFVAQSATKVMYQVAQVVLLLTGTTKLEDAVEAANKGRSLRTEQPQAKTADAIAGTTSSTSTGYDCLVCFALACCSQK